MNDEQRAYTIAKVVPLSMNDILLIHSVVENWRDVGRAINIGAKLGNIGAGVDIILWKSREKRTERLNHFRQILPFEKDKQ